MVATSLAIDLNLNPFHITTYDDDIPRVPAVLQDVPSGNFYNDADDQLEEERSFGKELVDDSMAGDLSRISNENKKLKEMLRVVWNNYKSLQTHVNQLMHGKELLSSNNPKKRKVIDHENVAQTSSWKRPNKELPKTGIRIVHVQTDPADKSLVVKDGYQWRKYGQKVTRDNPFPRAYYKCCFAPNCPVKKKVQRSLVDDAVVVATYEGEHNHTSTKQHVTTYDLANEFEISSDERRFNSPRFDMFLVKQMATCLIKDPNFTSELAAAISTKILEVDMLSIR